MGEASAPLEQSPSGNIILMITIHYDRLSIHEYFKSLVKI